MQAIFNFFETLYEEHFYVIIIAIILFAIILISTIVYVEIRISKKEEKMFKENAKNAVTSLTPEEIDNISNNVADKETFYEFLNQKAEQEEEQPKQTKTTSKKCRKSKAEQVVAIDENEKENNEVVVQNVVAIDKKPTKTTTKKPAQTTSRAYTGKWKVKESNGKFYAELTASNGGTLLKTEMYTTLTGLKNGIVTIKKNVDSGNMVISLDKNGHYHFKLYSSANRLICVSEDYSSKAKCESGILSVKRFAKTAIIIIEDSEEA